MIFLEKKQSFCHDNACHIKSSAFVDFLARNQIDHSWYGRQAEISNDLPRYIRVDGRYIENLSSSEKQDVTTRILEEFPGSKPLAWLPNFFSLPHSSRLKGSKLYETGVIHGMDAASGFAVLVLDAQPGNRVLDLCCAPGAKFAFIADQMDRQGELIGVDAAPLRIHTCVSLCKKYRVCQKDNRQKNCGNERVSDWDCTIVMADGVKFSSPWLVDKNSEIVWCSDADATMFSDVSRKEAERNSGLGGQTSSRKRLSKTMIKHVRAKRDSKAVKISHSSHSSKSELVSVYGRYDRVLVDAECTHDGSLKHMEKYADGGIFGADRFEEKFLNADNTKHSSTSNSLQELQCGLIENGFSHLRHGGTLVYSTCSFCRSQNEDIVKWLLDTNKDAKLEPIGEELIFKDAEKSHPGVASKVLPGTWYFYPLESQTSGLFVAKLTRT